MCGDKLTSPTHTQVAYEILRVNDDAAQRMGARQAVKKQAGFVSLEPRWPHL